MEQKVNFYLNQEVLPDDFNNIQLFGEASLDHVVADAVSPNLYYTGLGVSVTGTTRVRVAPGRFYNNGAVYAFPTATDFDFLTIMPTVTQKAVAIVAWGDNADSQIQPRSYLTDLTTQATEPRTAAMETDRRCNVQIIEGLQSVSPQLPTIPTGTVLVCTVILSTSGIISVTMNAAGRLPNLDDVASRTRSLEGWRILTDPRISTITSDIAAIRKREEEFASLTIMREVAADVARLRDLSKLPASYVDYGTDHFLNKDASDPAQSGYSALVEEGVRFPASASTVEALSLQNSLDPTVTNTNGLILPLFTNALRFSNAAGFSGQDYLSSFQVQTTVQVQQPMSRTRIRYGPAIDTCTNQGYMNGRDINLNTALNTFLKDGETFTVLGYSSISPDGTTQSKWVNVDPTQPATQAEVEALSTHAWLRIARVFVDDYAEPYWALETVTQNVSGYQVGQVFLNPQDGWLTQVGIFVPTVGPTGAIQVSICTADSGKPDLLKVIASVSLPQANIATPGQNPTETLVTFAPTFLQGGRRYAIVLQSAGNHGIAHVTGGNVVQGAYYKFQDSAWQVIDATQSLMCNMYFAKFSVSYLAVSLQPLTLSGGIENADILFQGVIPSSTKLDFQVLVDGAWMSLNAANAEADIFGSAPPLCQLRMVFLGTPDVMPAINLTTSQAKVYRPATAFVHFSKVRTLVTPTTSVTVILLLEGGFDPAHHACNCYLIVSGSPVSPSATTDLVTDTGTQRSFHFTISSSSSYRVKITGTTDDTQNLFHVSERTDVAF